MDISLQRRLLANMLSQLEEGRDGSEGENLRDYLKELSVIDNHPADIASEDYQRNLDASFQEMNEHLLDKIQGAIARIDRGEYDICRECGGIISPQRLQALPYVDTCAKCAKSGGEAPGKSRSYPQQGEFTWPWFRRYGTGSGEGEQPPDRV